MLENDVRVYRVRRGWSQDDLANRSGLSRAGISAIETGRLVPSTAAALALAAALECTVESLFRLPGSRPGEGRDEWSWAPPATDGRYWRAEVRGRRYLYPVEVSPLGLLPHDGTAREGAPEEPSRVDPARTLVLATCDPAAGLLAAELARQAEVRLIVLRRTSRAGLDLLARGLVHAAGVHLARADQAEGNVEPIRQHLAEAPGPREDYHVLRVADWDEGIALRPGLGLDTIRAVVAARLRWVLREPGSGARQCLDEILDAAGSRRPSGRSPRALDHRGVAEAIRAESADAGICLRLASAEAGLGFLSVRREAYEICLHDSVLADPRGRALLQVVRSSPYRRLLADLPGYDAASAGDLRPIRDRRG
jgi:molybdate-binding protein/DNA-binding XRE family transcriptional regulator